MRRARIGVIALVACLSACAGLPGPSTDGPGAAGDAGAAPASVVTAPAPTVAPGTLAPFSTIGSLATTSDWSTWTMHSTKRPTRYRLVDFEGERVLEASADRAASGLLHKVDAEASERPILDWRWRIESTVEGADVGDRHADDSPVRLMLAFDGDKATLPVGEQMFFERVKLIGGQDLPYATLMYVWDNAREVETVARNSHTSRIRKIVVDSGPKGVRQWRRHRRDVVADFTRAYGKPPGRLIAIGVLTDTDNTKRTVRAWYGDIRLLERPR
jgi:hypothetical protein